MQFNEKQKEIIEIHEGNYCVSANPGSGKTSTMVERVNHLVNNYNEFQHDIIVISFTRAAVDSLKKKLGALGLENVHVHTFHSLSAKILTETGINVSKTIPLWKVENAFRKVDPKPDTENILSWIGFQKNHGKTYKDDFVYNNSDYSEEELRIFFKLYEEEKQKEGAYDFEDWIIMALKELKKNPIKYKFVISDEVQDSNDLNIKMLKAISDKNLMVIGDAKQSIYGFRGSNPTFFMNFDKEFPNAIVSTLDINYRSVNNIVQASNKFVRPWFKGYSHYSDSISNNQNNGIIELISSSSAAEESLKVVNTIEKMIQVGKEPKDIAILYRLNSNSEYIEAELRKRKIPYDIANDSSFFKRKEISMIVNYLRLIDNIYDDGAFADIFNARNIPLKFVPATVLEDVRKKSGNTNKSLYETFIDFNFSRPWITKSANDFHNNITRLIMQRDKGISIEEIINNVVKVFDLHAFIKEKYPNKEDATERIGAIEVLKSFVKGNNLKSFIEFAINGNITKKKKDGVQMCTVHRAKGLEWDTVFLVGVQDTKFPHMKCDINEEARLFYVAITRSETNLYISQIGTDNQFVDTYFKGVNN
jgi:DNA helicase-2/ATP-dependent DNA helicase PcrA